MTVAHGNNKDFGYYDKDTETYTYPVRKEESDINRLAVPSTTHGNRSSRDTNATTEVPVANSTTTWNELKTTDDSSRGKSENRGISTETNEDREEKKRVGSEYPYNQVRETESGHILEYVHSRSLLLDCMDIQNQLFSFLLCLHLSQ